MHWIYFKQARNTANIHLNTQALCRFPFITVLVFSHVCLCLICPCWISDAAALWTKQLWWHTQTDTVSLPHINYFHQSYAFKSVYFISCQRFIFQIRLLYFSYLISNSIREDTRTLNSVSDCGYFTWFNLLLQTDTNNTEDSHTQLQSSDNVWSIAYWSARSTTEGDLDLSSFSKLHILKSFTHSPHTKIRGEETRQLPWAPA